jgi:hypothetical protein
MSKEDNMTETLIEWATESSLESDDREFSYEVEPEAHYNYYGDRGVADLYIREIEDMDDGRTFYYDKLYEIKSEAAVKSATGANEVIRQFNKMRKYFYKDESRTVPTDVHFELLFLPTEVTIEHLSKNMTLYQNCQANQLCEEVPSAQGDTAPAIVTVRDGSEGIGQPARLTSPYVEVEDGISWKSALKEIGGDNRSHQTVINLLDDLGY